MFMKGQCVQQGRRTTNGSGFCRDIAISKRLGKEIVTFWCVVICDQATSSVETWYIQSYILNTKVYRRSRILTNVVVVVAATMSCANRLRIRKYSAYGMKVLTRHR